MKILKILMLGVFLLPINFAVGQDQNVGMYGLRPVETQEAYDSYMHRLYVTRPYLQEDYERDVFNLYSQLQNYKKLSVYCQGKAKDYDKKRNLNVKDAYNAWLEKNKDYIKLVNLFWNKFTVNLDAESKLELLEKIKLENKESIRRLENHHDVSEPCGKIFDTFAFEDSNGKLIARESENKKFSDSYRNVDFFINPEKKEIFRKELKKQLDAGLARGKACKKSGGEWVAIGMAQRMGCVTKYPDAGKSCTDSSQCKGGCLQVSGFSNGPVRGACKKDDNPFGCPRYLHNGKSDGPIVCRD